MDFRPAPVAYVVGFLFTLAISPFAMKGGHHPLQVSGLIAGQAFNVEKAEIKPVSGGQRLTLRRGNHFAPESEIQVWMTGDDHVSRVQYRHRVASNDLTATEDWTQTAQTTLKLARQKHGVTFFELDLVHGPNRIHAEGDVAN